MHCSHIFKALTLTALLLLVAAPALAAGPHDPPPEPVQDVSQSQTTMRAITRTSAVTAAHTTLDAILTRHDDLHGFGGDTTAEAGTIGASAGNSGMGIGVWASGGWQHMNKYSSQWSRGNMFTATAGIDKRIGDAVLGISAGGEWLRLDMSDSGRFHYDGFSLTPYFSYALLPTLVMDAAMGLGWQNNRQKTTYISGSDGLRHDMEEDYASWRLFTSAGLSKYWAFDNWTLSGRVGGMYLHQNSPSYTLRGSDGFPFSDDSTRISKNLYDLFQLSLGGRVGYRFGNFSPFVGATYIQDVAKSGRQEDFAGADFQAGFNYRVGNFSLGLTGTYGIRYAFNKIGGMLNLRLDF